MVCSAPGDGAASEPVGSEASSGGEEELIIPEDDPVIEQLKDILDEWSRGRPDGSEISRVAIIRTEKVQILKDILASWEDGGEESDASELSDSAPSDSGDDGSDAASVDEGDAAEGHIIWSPVDIKSLQVPAVLEAAGAPVEPAAM
ncbi:unnamed protein product, partial [Symbiodinium necroappetens]